MNALGCERSRSSTKETGYQCADQEKGGTSVGCCWAEGEAEGEGSSEEEEESGGGAVAAAAPAAAAEAEETEAAATEAAAAAAAAAAPLLLGVAQTTLLLCVGAWGGPLRARLSRRRPRGVGDVVAFVTVVDVAMGAIGAPWTREGARIVAVFVPLVA